MKRLFSYQIHSNELFPAFLVAVVLGLSAGCGQENQVRLHQPQLSGWQREIQLLVEEAVWTTDASHQRVLAEFPLPGAMAGRPAYLLYLRMPAGEETVSFDHRESDHGRGFFIQVRGQFAGLTHIVGGQTKISGRSESPRSTRWYEIDLACEDGTELRGVLKAGRIDWAVEEFENQRRPEDVKSLLDQADSPESGRTGR